MDMGQLIVLSRVNEASLKLNCSEIYGEKFQSFDFSRLHAGGQCTHATIGGCNISIDWSFGYFVENNNTTMMMMMRL